MTIAVLVTHGASLGQESYDGITPLNYCPLKDIVRIVFHTVFEGNIEAIELYISILYLNVCDRKLGEDRPEWIHCSPPSM